MQKDPGQSRPLMPVPRAAGGNPRAASEAGSPYRVVLRLAVGFPLLAICLASVISWRIHSSNASEDRAIFGAQAVPGARQRIMVFSPHCDDEALGAGGFIHAAVRSGADVRIVMMTNGDGFEFAAAWHYKQLQVTPRLLRTFAEFRQKEAIRADGVLGVPADHIIFLGYPDKGLAALWTSNWSPEHLYYSRLTGCNHNPYTNTPHPGQPYCGASILRDVEEQLEQFHPDLVLMPHPNDDHPDHWATSSFVRAALTDLERKASRAGKPDWVARTQHRVFLVHHGDWPVPQGYHPRVRLAPPFSLARTDILWSQFALEPADEQAKLAAIHQYASQMAVMGRFLESFVRETECFGNFRAAVLRLARRGDPGRSGVLVGINPTSDTLLHSVEPGANIERVSASQEGSSICLHVRVNGHISPRVVYTLRLKQIDTGGKTQQQWYATVRNHRADVTIPGASAVTSGESLDVCIPTSLFATAPDWFVSAESRTRFMVLDRAGWREFHVAPLTPLPSASADVASLIR